MKERQPALFADGVWLHVKDGNLTARHIFDAHYSRYFYKDGRKPKLFVGPGEKMVLVSPCAKALFAWRKFISADGQDGVNCAIFRNEGAGKSSDLILAAETLALARWPNVRFYTYVDAEKTAGRRGRNHKPGHCFIMAGWKYCGLTKKRGLVILEKLPKGVQ